jgi:hypothetical protein
VGGALRRLSLEVGFEIKGLPKVEYGTSLVSKKEDRFPNETRIVLETEQDIPQTRILFFRSSLVDDKLGENENGAINILLGFEEEFKTIFFKIDELLSEALWIDQENKGRNSPLKSRLVETGFIRARKSAVSRSVPEMRENGLYKLAEG